MKWKTFFQIVLLMIVAGVIFYIVYPKYEFFHKPDDARKDLTNYYRCNKITGTQQVSATAGGNWL